VTTDRYQLVVEGTREPNPTDDDWQAYEFKGQPVATDERPSQWAPYHLRLDWQLWFAAMRPKPGSRQRWFKSFLAALFENDAATLSLLESNPFPDGPPEQLRVIRYRYGFTTREERAETRDWWRRERVGTYVMPVSEADLRAGGIGRRRRVF